MKLGDILAELREDRGLTQHELSKQLHISNSSISAYELGSRLPNIETLLGYAEFFDVTVDYLLGLTPEPISPSVFKQAYNERESVGSIINKLLTLDPDQRSALCTIIENMKFYADVRRKTASEGKDDS